VDNGNYALWSAAMLLVSLIALTIAVQYSTMLAVVVWFLLTMIVLAFRPE
jgi:hypothetical protein